MSGACYCGRCYGCRAAWEAGERPDGEIPEGRDSQHVLKAEGESPDATDRENRANASPDGGPMGAGQVAAAAPSDALDAARYRWLRDESNLLSYTSDSGPQPSTPESRMMYAINSAGKRTLDMIEIRLLCYHLGPYDEPIWRDGEHFDYAANMDAAIDAAMASLPSPAQQDQPKGAVSGTAGVASTPQHRESESIGSAGVLPSSNDQQEKPHG